MVVAYVEIDKLLENLCIEFRRNREKDALF